MIEIKFIGTGGAFDYEYLNSSALVTLGETKILLDCGHSIYPALRELNATDIMDYVLVTHLHDDHVGSLSSLLAYNLHFNNKKLTILYPDQSFLESLLQFFQFTLQNPEKYANFQPISNFKQMGFINTYGQHVREFQTYAYYFEEGDQRIVYSADLSNCEALFKALGQLVEKQTTVFHDITFSPDNKAHTYYKNLEPYTDRYKIIGYHCDPRLNPSDNKIQLTQNLPEYLLKAKT